MTFLPQPSLQTAPISDFLEVNILSNRLIIHESTAMIKIRC